MKPIIEYQDFEKLDIRAGRVISCSLPDWSEKLIELKVDFGNEIGVKTVLAGIKKWINLQDLEGRKFPFIVNFAERKMGEGLSQAMMLVASSEEGVKLITLDAEIQEGCVIR